MEEILQEAESRAEAANEIYRHHDSDSKYEIEPVQDADSIPILNDSKSAWY